MKELTNKIAFSTPVEFQNLGSRDIKNFDFGDYTFHDLIYSYTIELDDFKMEVAYHTGGIFINNNYKLPTNHLCLDYNCEEAMILDDLYGDDFGCDNSRIRYAIEEFKKYGINSIEDIEILYREFKRMKYEVEEMHDKFLEEREDEA